MIEIEMNGALCVWALNLKLAAKWNAFEANIFNQENLNRSKDHAWMHNEYWTQEKMNFTFGNYFKQKSRIKEREIE